MVIIEWDDCVVFLDKTLTVNYFVHSVQGAKKTSFQA